MKYVNGIFLRFLRKQTGEKQNSNCDLVLKREREKEEEASSSARISMKRAERARRERATPWRRRERGREKRTRPMNRTTTTLSPFNISAVAIARQKKIHSLNFKTFSVFFFFLVNSEIGIGGIIWFSLLIVREEREREERVFLGLLNWGLVDTVVSVRLMIHRVGPTCRV